MQGKSSPVRYPSGSSSDEFDSLSVAASAAAGDEDASALDQIWCIVGEFAWGGYPGDEYLLLLQAGDAFCCDYGCGCCGIFDQVSEHELTRRAAGHCCDVAGRWISPGEAERVLREQLSTLGLPQSDVERIVGESLSENCC